MKIFLSSLLTLSAFLMSCDIVENANPTVPEKITETPRLREVSLFFASHEGGTEEVIEIKPRKWISTKKFGDAYPQFPATIDLNEGTLQIEIRVSDSLIEKWNGSLELRNMETEKLLWETGFSKESRVISLPNVFLQHTTSVQITVFGEDMQTIYEKYKFTLAVDM